MDRPSISIGRAVKIYQSPNYGREDAVCTAVNNTTGAISARTVKTQQVLTGVVHLANFKTGSPYWRELPVGFVAGSAGQ